MLNRRHFLRNAGLLGAGAAFATLPASQALADETMRLYWWGTPSRAERTFGVVELFEAANAGVTINGEVGGGSDYWPKLSTMISGGNAPDIFQLEPGRFADFSRRGTNIPLNDYLGKIIRTDRLAPGTLDLGTVDGKVTGIPMSLNAFAMIYDTEAFKQAGITPPSEKTSWDDFAKICIDLTKAIDKKNVWAMGNGARYNYLLEAFLVQRGKRLFNEQGGIGFDVNDAKDWYGYWDSLSKNGGCVPAEIQALDKMNVDSNPLATGNSVIAIGFSNQLQGYQAVLESPLALTTIPVLSADSPSGLFYRPGLHWSIASTSKNAELAARFIDFFINDLEAGKLLSVERGVPVNLDVKETVLPLLDPTSKATVDYITSIEGIVGPYPPPAAVGATEYDERALRPIADKLAFGQLTPAQAAEEVVAAAKTILKV